MHTYNQRDLSHAAFNTCVT